MDFKLFRDKINQQFSEMSNYELFQTEISKKVLWETYLDSFPPGTNEIFRERRFHDCNCCKQFIRSCGNVVAITPDLKLVSIWDVVVDDEYQVVADEMSKLVKKGSITNKFLHFEKNLGNNHNFDIGLNRWDHFYFDLPSKFVNKTDKDTVLSDTRANVHVFERGLKELSTESLETVLELISQNSIYRGEEHREAVQNFFDLKKNFPKKTKKQNLYIWQNAKKPGARIRNTAIGSLLVDISEGIELDQAVKSFESKVAPMNYKRPSAIISKNMIKNAQKKIDELGFSDSLERRNATMDDLTINNVLFANRETKKALNVFDEMVNEIKESKKNFQKVEKVSIQDFISNILPKVNNVEIMFENKHKNNLMSLVAPVNENAPGMFKWGNNFSWAYNGDVTDSIRERVKRAGGNVDAVLRCSLAWYNYDDLDIHVKEPNGTHIYFGNTRSNSSAFLDVDMNAGGGNSRNAVENIAWTKKTQMQEGIYEVWINQYNLREHANPGFEVEIEYEGKTLTFKYDKMLKTKENVHVAKFSYSKRGGIKIIESLKSEESSEIVWGIKTQKFHKVKMIMNSPNHWDGEKTGNKHYFFILENCNSGEPVRGFFNEFLNEKLTEHRKVFEVLGEKLKTDKSEQLSGLGFSSTKKDSIICKVTGSFTRALEITF
jgi:hypothetical protein